MSYEKYLNKIILNHFRERDRNIVGSDIVELNNTFPFQYNLRFATLISYCVNKAIKNSLLMRELNEKPEDQGNLKFYFMFDNNGSDKDDLDYIYLVAKRQDLYYNEEDAIWPTKFEDICIQETVDKEMPISNDKELINLGKNLHVKDKEALLIMINVVSACQIVALRALSTNIKEIQRIINYLYCIALRIFFILYNNPAYNILFGSEQLYIGLDEEGRKRFNNNINKVRDDLRKNIGNNFEKSISYNMTEGMLKFIYMESDETKLKKNDLKSEIIREFEIELLTCYDDMFNKSRNIRFEKNWRVKKPEKRYNILVALLMRTNISVDNGELIVYKELSVGFVGFYYVLANRFNEVDVPID